MKVKTKVPFYDRKGLHKKNEVVEIETAAFNPLTMVEIPEKKSAPIPVPFIEEAVAEEKVEEPVKPKRTRKKKV